MPVAENSETSRLWAKLAALVLLIAALGLPINDLYRYGLLLAGLVVIFCGRISLRPRSWLIASALVVASIGGRLLIPAPLIEEGHNVFLVDQPGGALEQGLPAEAYRLMAAEFEAAYPRPADAGWRKAVPTTPLRSRRMDSGIIPPIRGGPRQSISAIRRGRASGSSTRAATTGMITKAISSVCAVTDGSGWGCTAGIC